MKKQETMMLYSTKMETANGLHNQVVKPYFRQAASTIPMMKYWLSGIFCTSWQAMPQSSICWSRKEQTMNQIN